MNDGKKFYSLESEIEIILEKSKCLLLIKSSILIQTCLLMEIMVYRFYPSVLYGRRTLSLFDMAPCGIDQIGLYTLYNVKYCLEYVCNTVQSVSLLKVDFIRHSGKNH